MSRFDTLIKVLIKLVDFDYYLINNQILIN